MPSTICSTSQTCRLLKRFLYCMTLFIWGFPHSSVGKESSCNAGDLGSIPGSRRSTGEGKVYPLQYSWASLVAQLVKNLPAMWKTWVRSLGWEDPLEKEKATHSSILAWRIPWVHGVAKGQTWLSNFHFHIVTYEPFYPWVGKIPWRRESLPTPVFWPGEFHELYIAHGVAKSRTRLSD